MHQSGMQVRSIDSIQTAPTIKLPDTAHEYQDSDKISRRIPEDFLVCYQPWTTQPKADKLINEYRKHKESAREIPSHFMLLCASGP